MMAALAPETQTNFTNSSAPSLPLPDWVAEVSKNADTFLAQIVAGTRECFCQTLTCGICPTDLLRTVDPSPLKKGNIALSTARVKFTPECALNCKDLQVNVQRNEFDIKRGACWEEYALMHMAKQPHHPQCPEHMTSKNNVIERVVDVFVSLSRSSKTFLETWVMTTAILKMQGDEARDQQTVREALRGIWMRTMPPGRSVSSMLVPYTPQNEWRNGGWVEDSFHEFYPDVISPISAVVNTLVRDSDTVRGHQNYTLMTNNFLPLRKCVTEVKNHIYLVERYCKEWFGLTVEHDRDKLYAPMMMAYFIKWSGVKAFRTFSPVREVNAMRVPMGYRRTLNDYLAPPAVSNTGPNDAPVAETVLSELVVYVKNLLTPNLYGKSMDTADRVSQAADSMKKTAEEMSTTNATVGSIADTIQGVGTSLKSFFGSSVIAGLEAMRDNPDVFNVDVIFTVATILMNLALPISMPLRIMNGAILLGKLGIGIDEAKDLATTIYGALSGSNNENQTSGILIQEDVAYTDTDEAIEGRIALSHTDIVANSLVNFGASFEKLTKGTVIPFSVGFILFTTMLKLFKAKGDESVHWTKYYTKFGGFARDLIGITTLSVIGFEAVVIVLRFVQSVYTYLYDRYNLAMPAGNADLCKRVVDWKDRAFEILRYAAPVISTDKGKMNEMASVINTMGTLRKEVVEAQLKEPSPVLTTLHQILTSMERNLREMEAAVDASRRMSPARTTPFAIRLVGEAGVGKSVVCPMLAMNLCAMESLTPKQEDTCFAWSFEDKFKQAYKMQPVVVMDDPEINAANNNAFAQMILLISKTPVYVPKADVDNKDYVFNSPFIIVNTNQLDLAREDIQLRSKEAYMRRFVHTKVTAVGPIKKGSLSHLRFEIVKVEGSPSWLKPGAGMTYSRYVKVLAECYQGFKSEQSAIDEMYEKEFARLFAPVSQANANTEEVPSSSAKDNFIPSFGFVYDESDNKKPVSFECNCGSRAATFCGCPECGLRDHHFHPFNRMKVLPWDVIVKKARRDDKFARGAMVYNHKMLFTDCEDSMYLKFVLIALADYYPLAQMMEIIMATKEGEFTFGVPAPGADSVACALEIYFAKVREAYNAVTLALLNQGYETDMATVIKMADDPSFSSPSADLLFGFALSCDAVTAAQAAYRPGGKQEKFGYTNLPTETPWEINEKYCLDGKPFSKSTEDYMQKRPDPFTDEVRLILRSGGVEYAEISALKVRDKMPSGVYWEFINRRTAMYIRGLISKVTSPVTDAWQKFKACVPPWLIKVVKTAAVVLPLAAVLGYVIKRLMGSETFLALEIEKNPELTTAQTIKNLLEAGYVLAKQKVVGDKVELVAESNPYQAAEKIMRKAKIVGPRVANSNMNTELIYRKACEQALTLISVQYVDPVTKQEVLTTYHAMAVYGQWFVTNAHIARKIKALCKKGTMVRIMHKGFMAMVSPRDLVFQIPNDKIDIGFFRAKCNTVPANADITGHFITEAELSNLRRVNARMVYGEVKSPVRMTNEDLQTKPMETRVCYVPAKLRTSLTVRDGVEYYESGTCYAYSFKMFGNCGWPLFSDDPSCPKILGLHTAGGEAESDKTGYCTVLTREFIEEFREKNASRDDVSITAEAGANLTRFYAEECDSLVPGGDYAFRERVPASRQVHLPQKSPFRRMPTFDLIVKNDREPTAKLEDDRNAFGENVLMNATDKYAEVSIPFDPSVLKEFQRGFNQECDQLEDDGNLILTIDQALNGVPFSHIEKLNVASSPGYPFTIGRRIAPGKKDWISGTEHLTATEELLDLIEERHSLIREGIRPDWIWTDAMKQELLPLEKVRPWSYASFANDGVTEAVDIYVGPKLVDHRVPDFLDQVKPTRTFKPRLINVPPMDRTILSRVYNCGFNNFLMQHRHKLGVLIGIDPCSSEWGAVADSLHEVSEKVSDADFKHFDGSHQRCVLRMIAGTYHHFNLRDPSYAGDVKQHRALFTLWEEMSTRFVILKDVIYRVNHGLPSGYDCTGQVNCIAQDFYYYAAWVEIMRANGQQEYANYSSFRLFVRTMKYGDDGLIAVHFRFERLFTAELISKVLKQYGIELQPAVKFVDAFSDARPIEQTTFLSRGFVPHGTNPSVTYAPLKEESVNALLNWVWKQGRDYTTACQENMVEHFRHLHPYGKHVYRKRLEDLRNVCKKLNFPIPLIPTWHELEKAFLEHWGVIDNTISLSALTSLAVSPASWVDVV